MTSLEVKIMEPQGQNAQLAGKLLCGSNRPIDWSGLLPGADAGPRAQASLRWTFRVIGGQP